MAFKVLLDAVGKDEKNAINNVAPMSIVDADTGQPIIEPETGRPAKIENQKAFDLTRESLEAAVAVELALLERRIALKAQSDANLAALQALVGTEIKPKVKTPKEVQDEVAINAANVKLNLLFHLRAVRGLDHPDTLAAQAEVDAIADANPEYFGLPRK